MSNTTLDLLATPGSTDRLVPMDGLLTRLCISRATAYRMMRRGDLPQPIKLGRRMIRFRQSDIDLALAKFSAGRTDTSAATSARRDQSEHDPTE